MGESIAKFGLNRLGRGFSLAGCVQCFLRCVFVTCCGENTWSRYFTLGNVTIERDDFLFSKFNACVGPLDVPEETRFLRCSLCGQHLTVRRSQSVSLIDPMEQLTEFMEGLVDDVASV